MLFLLLVVIICVLFSYCHSSSCFIGLNGVCLCVCPNLAKRLLNCNKRTTTNRRACYSDVLSVYRLLPCPSHPFCSLLYRLCFVFSIRCHSATSHLFRLLVSPRSLFLALSLPPGNPSHRSSYGTGEAL